MKKIEFDSIELKNFMSVGNDELVLKVDNGLNLITGHDKNNPNRKNGIGKSTICEGFFYGIYGDTIKKVNASEIINDKNKKNGSVKIHFTIHDGEHTDDIIIERKIKPSKCTLWINGEDKTLSSIPRTNEYIAKMIGIDKGLFKQSVILSIGKSYPFFLLSKADKRKFIEGIFNLNIFGRMFDDIKKSYNNTKKDLEYAKNAYLTIKNTLSEYIKMQGNFSTEKEETISALLENKNVIEKTIIRLEESIGEEEDVETVESNIETVREEYEEINSSRIDMRAEVKSIKGRIEELKRTHASIKDRCPECGRIYDDVDELNAKKQEYADKMQRLSQKIEEITKKGKKKKENCDKKLKKLRELEAELRKVREANNLIWKTKERIKLETKKLEDIDARIETERKKESPFLTLISEEKKKAKKSKDNVVKLEKDVKIDEICKLVLSEEGVKSMIVNELTGYLNRKINKYLNIFNTGVRCEFDMYFSETLMNLYGEVKSYDSFSAGEAKRIDLAVLLTFQDVLKEQSGIDIGISFYDEILDTSIDNDGREAIISLLKDKSNGHPVYIISHRSKMSDLIDKEIVLEKRNDFTYIKEIK